MGLICKNLSFTPSIPKSGEHDDQIAPRDAVAINVSTVWIKFGKYAATLSFFFIFSFLKKFAILATFIFNSFHFLISLYPFSLINVIAFELSFFDNKFSA